jgi:tetratricopeptide (TPR) repeat protein
MVMTLNDENKLNFDIKRRCRSVFRRLIQKSYRQKEFSTVSGDTLDCFKLDDEHKRSITSSSSWKDDSENIIEIKPYSVPAVDESAKDMNHISILPATIFHASTWKSTEMYFDFKDNACDDDNSNYDEQQQVDFLTDLTLAGAELLATNEYEASLLCYHKALIMMKQYFSKNYYHLARLSYICGRLSEKINYPKAAVMYYCKELENTTKFNEYHVHEAIDDICILECLRSLAKLHYDIGEFDIALHYYQLTLLEEQAALARLSDITPYNSSRVTELKHQALETKKCIGRIHFLSGNLDIAFRLSSVKIQH